MIPPGYKGYVPQSGYQVFKQETFFGWTLMRPIIKDKSPENVPVKNFWALTAYDIKTAAFIREMPSAGVSSIDNGLKANADGTTDLYMGPMAPKGKEGNWIPTAEVNRSTCFFVSTAPRMRSLPGAGS